MIIIQGRAGIGIKSKLIKDFCRDSNPATLITDQLTLSEIFNKMKTLDILDNLDWSTQESKNILTEQNINCDADYYNLIGSINTTSVYIDLCFSKSWKDDIIKFCLGLEREYGVKYLMTETLPVDSKILGINIIELKGEE